MAVDDVRHADGLQVRLVVQGRRRDDGREAGELCELNGFCENVGECHVYYSLCVEANNLRSPYCPTEVDPPKMTIGWPLYRPVPAPAASQGGVSFLEPASTLSAYSPIVAVASARETVAPSSKEILGGSLYWV